PTIASRSSALQPKFYLSFKASSSMADIDITNPARAVAARSELEQISRGSLDKVTTASRAVDAYVSDGDVIAVGGTNHARTPMALLWEVLRQGRSGLSLSRPLTCYESELFIAHGAANRVITSWVGVGHGWGLARVLRE